MPDSNNKPIFNKPRLADVKAAAAKGKPHRAGNARKPQLPVAAAAKKHKKQNPRSAKARDERAKRRGRLPKGVTLSVEWDGLEANCWHGEMTLWGPTAINTGEPVKTFQHKADGLFRLCEELDIMFWNWLSSPGDEDIKAKLVFAPEPPVPEKFVNPEASAGKA